MISSREVWSQMDGGRGVCLNVNQLILCIFLMLIDMLSVIISKHSVKCRKRKM